MLFLLAAQVLAQPVTEPWRELPLKAGGVLAYKLGLPHAYDPAQTYPALLALPPGPQTAEMVEASWPRYWGAQASARGWIVVSPAAPEGRTFFDGSEALLSELIEHVHAQHHVEHGRLHLAGSSNGGRSAFRIATLEPRAFLSLTVLPGYPPTSEDEARLGTLVGLPVSMYAGGDDLQWVARMQQTAAALRTLGVDVTTTVLPGEGHTPESLDGDAIIERLEFLRRRYAPSAAPVVVTTVFVVRHADRRGTDDALSEAGHARAEALALMLGPTSIDAVHVTQFTRSQQTVEPTARAQGLTPEQLPADADLAAHLLAAHAGQTVLVAGHSNTVPEILAGLGVSPAITLAEDRYGDLFVVTISGETTRLLHLRY